MLIHFGANTNRLYSGIKISKVDVMNRPNVVINEDRARTAPCKVSYIYRVVQKVGPLHLLSASTKS